MAVESVTANSRNSRPTMPPISRIGMNTAISEMLMDSTVKPISLAPFSAAANGCHAHFEMARDVLHHHDGVVHHKAGGDGQRHQRQVVEASSRAGTSRRRCRSARPAPRRGNERGASRCAGRRRPPGSPGRSEMISVRSTSLHRGRMVVVRSRTTVDVDALWESTPAARAAAARMRSTVSMMLAPGWRKMIMITDALAVQVARPCACSAPNR